MSLDEAAEYALSEGIGRSTRDSCRAEAIWHGEPAPHLSRREREVVALVARGLTNRQISAELSISERTAGNHVGRILAQAETPLADPDRHLGHRTRARSDRTRNRARLRVVVQRSQKGGSKTLGAQIFVYSGQSIV